MPAVSPEAIQRNREKARLRMAEKSKTPEHKEYMRQWNADNKEKRRLYKERQRRNAGVVPSAQLAAASITAKQAKLADHDAHFKLWKQVCSLAWLWHRHRNDPQWQATRPHDAHVRQWNRDREGDAARHRYHTDPEFNASEKMRSRLRKKTRLDGAVSAHIASRLKAGKFSKGWRDLLGYTPASLITHLRRTLPKGRTWGDFMAGRLHIDHITPCASFDLSRVEEVRACWALGNLRLIDATENLRKSAKQEFLL
jgi:hypothetical protein